MCTHATHRPRVPAVELSGQQVWNSEHGEDAIDNDRAPHASVHLNMLAQRASAKPPDAQQPVSGTQALSSTAAEPLPLSSVTQPEVPKKPDAVLVSVPHLFTNYEACAHFNVIGLD